MSRSKLRNNFIRSLYKGHSFFAAKMNNPVRNPIDKTRCRRAPLHGSFGRIVVLMLAGFKIQRVVGPFPTGGWPSPGKLTGACKP